MSKYKAEYEKVDLVKKYGHREKIINVTELGVINVKDELNLDEDIADIFPGIPGKYKLSINNPDCFLKWERI